MGVTPEKIEIYVVCLASYNNNTLHGADQDAGSIHDEIRAMLQASPVRGAEDYAPRLNGEAKSKEWQKYVEASQQGQLF